MILFFNAGNDPAPGDIYFIDDLSWGEKTVEDIENFDSSEIDNICNHYNIRNYTINSDGTIDNTFGIGNGFDGIVWVASLYRCANCPEDFGFDECACCWVICIQNNVKTI
jgi:hypothetical protein